MMERGFNMVPSPEFQTEIERICQQYEGFKRVKIKGRFLEFEQMNLRSGEMERKQQSSFFITAHFESACITAYALQIDTLVARFYDKLARKFEVDLIPIENF